MYCMRPILVALLKSILLLSSALSLYYTNPMTRALNNSQTNPVLVTTHNQCTNTHRHVINAAYSIDFIYNRSSHFFSVILSNDAGRWENGARLKKEGLLREVDCFW